MVATIKVNLMTISKHKFNLKMNCHHLNQPIQTCTHFLTTSTLHFTFVYLSICLSTSLFIHQCIHLQYLPTNLTSLIMQLCKLVIYQFLQRQLANLLLQTLHASTAYFSCLHCLVTSGQPQFTGVEILQCNVDNRSQIVYACLVLPTFYINCE